VDVIRSCILYFNQTR